MIVDPKIKFDSNSLPRLRDYVESTQNLGNPILDADDPIKSYHGV